MKRGTVFTGGREEREVKVARNLARLRMVVKWLVRGGRVLVGVAIVIVVITYWPVVQAEIGYFLGRTRVGRAWVKLVNTEVNFVTEVNFGEIGDEKPTWKVPDQNYSIYIPKILAKSRVISEVDIGDRGKYLQALKKGVAEAAGLAHPGEKGTTYLFAHSVGSRADFARYNAIFYLLDKLVAGDTVEIVYQKKLYRYVVVGKEVVGAGDLKYLRPQTEEERLVLQTCYPPGTTWKRLMVVAKRAR